MVFKRSGISRESGRDGRQSFMFHYREWPRTAENARTSRDVLCAVESAKGVLIKTSRAIFQPVRGSGYRGGELGSGT